MYSKDGKNWQVSTGASFAGIGKGIAYDTSVGNLIWVAVGAETTLDGPGKTLYSTNGIEWQEPKDPNIFSISGNGVASKSILPNV